MKVLRPCIAMFLACTAMRARAVDFEEDLQPILKKECYECHSAASGKEKGGYVFDNLARLKKDIDLMLLVMPGNPEASNLFKVLADPEVEHHMPPRRTLADADIEKVRAWIAEGAPLGKKTGSRNEGSGAAGVKKAPPPVMIWTNASGVTIKAGFGGIQGDHVILKLANGQSAPYPLASLSEASRKQAQDCATP